MLFNAPDIESSTNVEKKKNIQKLKIIKYLYINGPQTSAAICDRYDISFPTFINLIKELIAEGYVENKGYGESIGGRKPKLYGLHDDSLYVIGIEMDRFKTRMAIFDSNNHNVTNIHSVSIHLTAELDALDTICEHVKELISSSGINNNKIVGIGISMPGLVNSKEGRNYTYLLTPDNSCSLQNLLENKLDKPVFIENDVKAATLAEFRFGLANGRKDALVISMDWGIGLGIIMDGKLRRGTTGFSGEFGHIPLVENGELCYCGKRGCLETVASGIALARLAKEGVKSGENSMLNLLSDQEIDELEPQIIIAAANAGDQYAVNILSQIGLNLGKGIAILIQLFNPEIIILGGKIAKAKQYITIPIQQSLNNYCKPFLREKTSIKLSKLGEESSLCGPVAMVMEYVFNKHIDLNKIPKQALNTL